MHIWNYDSLDGNLSLKLTIFMFFCSYDPLSEGYCTPWNITFEQNSYIISFRRSQSICLGNILAFRCNKGGASGPFLKKCPKTCNFGSFCKGPPLQNFTESNISLSGHFPPLPKPQTKIFLNHCDAIRTSKKENLCPPPLPRNYNTREVCGWDRFSRWGLMTSLCHLW